MAKNINEAEYDLFQLFDEKVLVTPSEIDRSSLPDGFYAYTLKECNDGVYMLSQTDTGSYGFCTTFGSYSSVIAKKPIVPDEMRIKDCVVVPPKYFSRIATSVTFEQFAGQNPRNMILDTNYDGKASVKIEITDKIAKLLTVMIDYCDMKTDSMYKQSNCSGCPFYKPNDELTCLVAQLGLGVPHNYAIYKKGL